MFKSLIITASLGFLVLLIAIIILGWLNWSEKFYTPLTALGAALALTLAGFITVTAMLKEDAFGSEFTTFIVVNTDSHLPVAPTDFTPGNMELMRNQLAHV